MNIKSLFFLSLLVFNTNSLCANSSERECKIQDSARSNGLLICSSVDKNLNLRNFSGNRSKLDTVIESDLQNRNVTIQKPKSTSMIYGYVSYANVFDGHSYSNDLLSDFDDEIKSGVEIGVGYRWFSQKGVGFGLGYTSYLSQGDLGRETIKINLESFSGSLETKMNLGERWMWIAGTGIGYSNFKTTISESSANLKGVSIHLHTSIDYLIGRNFAIGLNAAYRSYTFGMKQLDLDGTCKFNIFSIGGKISYLI